MVSRLGEILGEGVIFIARLLAESLFTLLPNGLPPALVEVGRTAVLRTLWPLMLLMSWLRLWRTHAPRGLHRLGWQEAARCRSSAGPFTACAKILALSRPLNSAAQEMRSRLINVTFLLIICRGYLGF